MKTDMILVGITISLLLALPAAASDYTLEIFGNANEDDTINMQDVTYTELIILEYRDKTELSDAKYDSKINMQDVTQIELVILGKEKELTILDSAERVVTVNKPVQRVIALADLEVFEVIKAQDKIVGVYSQILTDKMFPEWSEVPGVGHLHSPDCEAIVSLNPDLVVTKERFASGIDEKLPDSIAVAGLDIYKAGTLIEEMEQLGYILDKEDEVDHYIDGFHDTYIDLIKERVEGLAEEKRPKVYVERRGTTAYKTYGNLYIHPRLVDRAGGKYLFADIEQYKLDADPEEVVMRNPDIIIKYIRPMDVGYDEDLFKIEAARARDEIINRPELANVNAVKNGMVYVFDFELTVGSTYPIVIAYWAKLFHPDIFEDLDPEAVHEEYLTEYKGVDLGSLPFDMNDEIWVYPPLEES